jgi:hypothetical protein
MQEMNCGREEELVGFLYDELDDAAKTRFAHHAESCKSCNSQLTSLTNVRQSVVAWRNESLGAVPTFDQRQPVVMAQPNRSALAALREFFNLSPLWAKGTLAFASLLFCLLAVLAVGRFNQTTPVNNVASENNPKSTQEFNAEVERRVKEELERRDTNQRQMTAAAELPPKQNLSRPVNVTKRSARTTPSTKTARPLSKLERQELAADLRLIEADSDLDLILIGDRINQ